MNNTIQLKSLQNIKLKNFKGVCSSSFPQEFLPKIINDMDDILTGKIGSQITHGHITTGRKTFEILLPPYGNILLKYYSDRYSHLGLYKQLKLARQPKRSFLYNCILWGSGISVPEPLFFLNSRQRPFFAHSICGTKYLQGYHTLRDFCFRYFQREKSSDNLYADLISNVILIISSVHKLGFSHGDLTPFNILVKNTVDSGTFHVCLTDFDYVQKRIGTPPVKRMLYDLSTLNASLYNTVPEDLISMGLEYYFDCMGIRKIDRPALKEKCNKKRNKLIVEFKKRLVIITDNLICQAENEIARKN